MRCKESLTGQYLSGAKKIYVPDARRPGNGSSIIVKGAREHNLKHIDVEFPLGKFVCVTGVSGSGKSSLVNEILYKGAARVTNRLQEVPGEYDEILGLEHIDKVIDIDPVSYTHRLARLVASRKAKTEARQVSRQEAQCFSTWRFKGGAECDSKACLLYTSPAERRLRQNSRADPPRRDAAGGNGLL